MILLYQRFLSGDDDYRNARLKMIPSLVDGPMPIRMVAPPKREKVVQCDFLPIIWKQLNEGKSADGQKTSAHLEATLDCMTHGAIRAMASLVKKYLQKLAVDVALVISNPDGQEEPEPSACLGLCRLNHIDVSMAPTLPDRFASESKGPYSPDVYRASKAMGLSQKQLKELAVEVQ